MNAERRLWIALILSALTIFGYQWWFSHVWLPKHRPVAAPAAAPVPAPESAAGPAASADYRTQRHARAIRESRERTRPAARRPAATEVVLETGSVRARISTAGGRLLSWQMTDYRATGTTVYEDLVPLRALSATPGPLSVRLSDFPDSAGWPAQPSLVWLKVGPKELEQRLPGRGETAVLPVGGGPTEGELVLTQDLPGGRRLVKRLAVPANGHEARLDLELDGPLPESLDVLWTPGVGLSPEEAAALGREALFRDVPAALVLAGRTLDVNRRTLLTQREAKAVAAKTGDSPYWVALRNKYFLAALIPPSATACEGVAAISGVASFDGAPHALTAALRFTLAPGATRARIPLRLYLGPQVYGKLQAAGERLEKAMDFGFFSAIALPLLFGLKFLATFIHNFGLCILVLTVLIKGALWVPSQWGLNQMRRLKEVQPQITFINEQYKDDPQRKQAELMRIYREKGVNPVGGCLPMLLQIPVFFALYSVLNNAIELRGAPLGFWIHDLSAHDPYYVLPVLVGISMWVQQAITPVAGDAEQAKMMRWMSLAFVLFFFKMPAGLNLYWLVSNLLTMGQQWNTNRQTAPATPGRT